jgi:hypothetical protein
VFGDFEESLSSIMCVGTVGAFTDAAVCLGEFGATDEEDILKYFYPVVKRNIYYIIKLL